jgi:hypothetical protein
LPPPEKSATATTTPSAGIFYDQEIDLHFNYPVEMMPLNGDSEMESGHLNIFGTSVDHDPEHLQAKRCMRPLLVADLPPDKAPQRDANMDGIWIDDTKEYIASRKPQSVTAKILLVEFVRDCVLKKVLKHEDDILGTLALAPVSIPGLQRQPQPLWFDVAGQKLHQNSGAGRPIINGQLAPAPVLMMAMAVQWRGHLLGWVFVSNDAQTFNEITKNQVRFGSGPWGTMFPANLGPKGHGTPLKILPK